MLCKGATWFLGLQEDLAARENGLRDAAGVPPVGSGSCVHDYDTCNAEVHKHQSASTSLSNLLSCDFDSPFHPRQLLKQLDLDEFLLLNQSSALSDPPSISTLVDMIRNHPSCKEVIQLLLSDEQCLSHA